MGFAGNFMGLIYIVMYGLGNDSSLIETWPFRSENLVVSWLLTFMGRIGYPKPSPRQFLEISGNIVGT